MKILCILPVFNGEGVIDKAVNSIINQTYKNWHLVIVNDASTDKTAKILKSFTKHPQITVLTNSINRGFFYSFNKALYQFKEEPWDVYTAHAADDTSSIDRFQIYTNIFKDNPKLSLLMGISSGKRWIPTKDISYSVKKSTPTYLSLNIEYLFEVKHVKGEFASGVSFFKRHVFNILGYYDNTRFGGDAEYHERFLQYLIRVTPKKMKFVDYKDMVVNALDLSYSYTYITGFHQTSENLTKKYNTFERQKYFDSYRNKIQSYEEPYEFYYNFIPE